LLKKKPQTKNKNNNKKKETKEMGNVNAASSPVGLQVSPHGAPIAHSELGIPVVFPADLVFDPVHVDVNAVNKWIWLNQDGEKLMLNPMYTLGPEEKEFFKLQFIVQILKTEAAMEAFYGTRGVTVQKMRMVGGSEQALQVLEQFRDTYESWSQATNTYWCDLPGLDAGNVELVDNVKTWLTVRNQPTTGSAPHELFARFCALKTGTLNPAPRIMRWAKALQLGLDHDPKAAVRVYCRVHLLSTHSLPSINSVGTSAPNDPFWNLKNGLVDEANANLAKPEMKRLVVSGAWQGPVPGLPLCGDPAEMRSRVALFRTKHVSRSFLAAAINGRFSGGSYNFRYDPDRNAARVNDLVWAVISGRAPLESIRNLPEFVGWKNQEWGQLQDALEATPLGQNPILVSFDFDKNSQAQYLDFLSEYGFPALLSTPLFPSNILRAVLFRLTGKPIDLSVPISEVRNEVLDMFESVLSQEWLLSWLADRKYKEEDDRVGVNPTMSRLDLLRQRYLQYSRCLYHSNTDETCMQLSGKISDALRPDFDKWAAAAAPSLLSMKPAPMPGKAWGADVAGSAALFADKGLIEALHMISNSIFNDEPDRLQRLCTLLNVQFDPDMASLRIFEQVMVRLRNDSSLLDAILNTTDYLPPTPNAADPKRATLITKLQELTKINEYRRAAMQNPTVVSALETNNTLVLQRDFRVGQNVFVTREMLDNYKMWYGDVFVSQQPTIRVLILTALNKPPKRIQWADPNSAQVFTFDVRTQTWDAGNHPPLTFAEAHDLLVANHGYSVLQVS